MSRPLCHGGNLGERLRLVPVAPLKEEVLSATADEVAWGIP